MERAQKADDKSSVTLRNEEAWHGDSSSGNYTDSWYGTEDGTRLTGVATGSSSKLQSFTVEVNSFARETEALSGLYSLTAAYALTEVCKAEKARSYA